MKWYNYEDTWINLDQVNFFEIANQKDGITIRFCFSGEYVTISFTPKESDAEFEKIKKLMGI